MKSWHYIMLALFLLLDAGAIYSFQAGMDRDRGGSAGITELAYLPKGEYLKKATLEYNMLMADVIWLKVIQVMGENKMPPEKARWIYSALDSASDLDPKFSYMCEAGGIYLSAVNGEYDLSNKLLKKGFDNNPGVWQLPFYIAVNYFLHMQEYKKAAYFMGRAAELPGRPEFVPLLATRLYAEAGNPKYAIELIERIYENTQDKRVRAALELRMKELVVEGCLDQLQPVVAGYYKKYHRYPASVRDLLDAGMITSLPPDPLGGRYLVDPRTGEVTNSKLKRRLKVFKKGG